MRTVQISSKVKEELSEYSKMGESFDATVNRLLDEVEDDLKNRVEFEGYGNIGVSDETLDRLQSFKLSHHDSYTKLLSDALSYTK